MRACEHEGVWGLIWASKPSSSSSSSIYRTKSRPGIQHDDEGQAGQKIVSNTGWDILGWLVDLWLREAREDQQHLSTLFLAQLPRKAADLQLDDARSLLSVVRSAYSVASNSARGTDANGAGNDVAYRLQRGIANNLLNLLTWTSLGKSPLFHPQTYTFSLLSLLRALQPRYFPDILSSLSKGCKEANAPDYVVVHLLTLYTEDLGGVREARMAQRRKRRPGIPPLPKEGEVAGAEADSVDGDGLVYLPQYNSFPLPSKSYLVNTLLPLPPRSDLPDAPQRMNVVKPLLCLYARRHITLDDAFTSSPLNEKLGHTLDQSALRQIAAVFALDE